MDREAWWATVHGVTRVEHNLETKTTNPINIYTLLYIKQIMNKNLLYSTGNDIHYLIIMYNGKKSEKEYI